MPAYVPGVRKAREGDAVLTEDYDEDEKYYYDNSDEFETDTESDGEVSKEMISKVIFSTLNIYLSRLFNAFIFVSLRMKETLKECYGLLRI